LATAGTSLPTIGRRTTLMPGSFLR
jgi:hypothetical protein